MTMEHTKWPWRLYPAKFRNQLSRTIQTGDGRLNLAKVLMGQSTEGEGLANARLMTAAPELLEVLSRALNVDCDGEGCACKWHEDARRVIAKAEGKDN